MKKFISLLLVLAMCLSLAACKNNDDVESESTTTAAEETTTEPIRTKEELLQDAREAYAAFLVQKISETPDPEGSPDSALVLDLDSNGIPEVICRSGNNNETYILSYGENDGLNVIIPQKHSGMYENIYYSEESGIFYYTDCGHNQGTAWYHEGVCLKASAEGFQTLGTVSGDSWDDAPDDIYENEELFYEYKTKYDNEFDAGMKELIGDGDFTEYDEVCVEENVWEYLSEELSANLTEKKAEYDAFKNKAIAAVDEDDLIAIHISDFDRNGTFEAFAFTGQENHGEYDPSYTGKILFVDSKGNVKTADEYDSGYFDAGEILTCQYHDYFQASRYGGSSYSAFLATVSDGELSVIFDFKDAGLEAVKQARINCFSNSLSAAHSTFDASTDGTGHTYKPYFFFDTPDGLREYGGTEISLKQFEKLGGSKFIEKYTDEEYSIENIYLRGNGIITVNLTKELESDYPVRSNNYIITKITNHSLSLITEWEDTIYDGVGEGHYSSSVTPELAVYPDLADFGL